MRITRAWVQERADAYQKEYSFTDETGWAQIREDLKPEAGVGLKLPRAVAYGAWMALCDLLEK